jgi:hypothetical protein
MSGGLTPNKTSSCQCSLDSNRFGFLAFTLSTDKFTECHLQQQDFDYSRRYYYA